MLKCTELFSLLILSKIFDQSLQLAALPKEWKVGKVVPVHKWGDIHSANNYRRISLRCIPSKMLEHIIYSHLISLLETNSFFNNAQHSFRKLSCDTQLLCFTDDLFNDADQEFNSDSIFLDFSRAFDFVSHDLLIFKLSFLILTPRYLHG